MNPLTPQLPFTLSTPFPSENSPPSVRTPPPVPSAPPSQPIPPRSVRSRSLLETVPPPHKPPPAFSTFPHPFVPSIRTPVPPCARLPFHCGTRNSRRWPESTKVRRVLPENPREAATRWH